jgi:hypothetical protein
MGRLLPRAQILLTFILLVAATACEQRIFTPAAVDAGVEVDAPGWQGPVIKFYDAAAIDRACVPIGCATAAGKYCGKIGDGCGGLLDCGGCEGAATCGGAGLPNVCAVPPGPGCTPLACEQPGGKLCGTIGDGCGKAKECGGCPAGQTCGGGGIAGVCGAPRAASCKPLTCEQAGGRLCGRVGDGCGGVLECGGCPGGQTCGGAGTPNVCGADGTTCRPLACEALGGKYCGTIGDGCGKTLDCGGCPAGQTCGGAGTPGVCGTPNGACRPLTCEQAGGRFCGTIGDGCGGTLECGDCPGGDGCGARAIAGVCGKPAGLCSPVSCDQPGGRYCGQVGDGCGGILDCGACPAGQACGGAGVTGVCAAPAGSCTPAKCEQAGGRLCGKVGDGCGKTLDCGECPAGQTCGGAGTPGVCGAPAPTGCAPVACEQAGVRHCGRIGDGCGRALECGECPAGQTCGGAGTPGVCGAPIPASCVPVTCEQAGGK